MEFKNHVTIFAKDGVFTLISLSEDSSMIVIGKQDKRNEPQTFVLVFPKTKDDEEGNKKLVIEATLQYNKAVKASQEVGWNIVYQGFPLKG